MEKTSHGTVVLLPGLDGTGIMLDDMADALRKTVEVRIISYPTDVFLDYDALVSFVRDQLPDGDVFIVGESFSGPVALRLAQVEPVKVKAVILGASFGRLDFPFKPVLSLLSKTFSPRLLPQRLLSALLLGRGSTPERREKLRVALASVAPHVLTARAEAALNADIISPGVSIRQPVLYLKALRDRIMPSGAANDLKSIANGLQVKEIDAPHFLFQVAALDCSEAILNFIGNIADTQEADRY